MTAWARAGNAAARLRTCPTGTPSLSATASIDQRNNGWSIRSLSNAAASPKPTSQSQKEISSTLPSQEQPVRGSASALGQKTKKTQSELDEELRQKLEGISGEGGASGIEYENGKPVAMKRSVRENMFRYI